MKFGETLPKVIQKWDVTQPAVLRSGRAPARPPQRESACQGPNAEEATPVLPTWRASSLSRRFTAHFLWWLIMGLCLLTPILLNGFHFP